MTMLDQETLTWYSADAPPDDDSVVLVSARDTEYPIWLGYHDEGRWFAIEGGVYKKGVVKAWSPLPTGATCAEGDVSGS